MSHSDFRKLLHGEIESAEYVRRIKDALADDALADEALQTLGRAGSVLDIPCECEGNPPTYKYRKDKRQHCMWCDGLAER
jgi:hypothetical protein